MKVPERDVIELAENGGVNVVGTADRYGFRIGAHRAGNELVGDYDAAVFGVYVHAADRRAYGIGICFRIFIRENVPYICGLYEREHEYVDSAVFVRQGKRRDLGGEICGISQAVLWRM